MLAELRTDTIDKEALDGATGILFEGTSGEMHCEPNCAPQAAPAVNATLGELFERRWRLCALCGTSWRIKASFRTSSGMLLRHAYERASLAGREARWLAKSDWTELSSRGGMLWVDQQQQWSSAHIELGGNMRKLAEQAQKTKLLLADFKTETALKRWANWAERQTGETAMLTTWFGTTRANVKGVLPKATKPQTASHLVAIRRDLGIVGPAQMLLLSGKEPTILAVDAHTAEQLTKWGTRFGWEAHQQQCSNPALGQVVATGLAQRLPLDKALKSAAAATQ